MRLLLPAVAAFGLLLLYDGLTTSGIRRPMRLLVRLDRLTAEAGMSSLSGARLVGLSASGGLATLVCIAGLTSSLVIAGAFAVVAAWSPFAIARTRRQGRARRFREAWPDALASLVAGVRAGVSLPECCASLAARGPADLRSGFAAFTSTYRATGSFHAGLERLKNELADPVADRVVVALMLAHEVGGSDLVRVLRALGDFVRENLRVRKEIQARWSWTVTAARVAAAAPWIVLLMMSARPEAAAAYNSATGAWVVAVGALVTVIGYKLMLRAARLPEEGRLRG